MTPTLIAADVCCRWEKQSGRRRPTALVSVAACQRKAAALPSVGDDLRYAVAAREEVGGNDDLLVVTARDIFA